MILAVIALGLASRRFPFLFPAWLGKYPGDALWAAMVFLGYALLKPTWPTRRLAVAALATSFLVEFSQLYHAPWLDAIRGNFIGHLVLGSEFSRVDLVAYVVGVAIGAGLEVAVAGAGRKE